MIGQLHSLRGTVRLARFRLRHHRPSLDHAIRHLEQAAARLRASTVRVLLDRGDDGPWGDRV